MGKVIEFPFKKNNQDYINILSEISRLKQDIELSEGYNEFYRDFKTPEEYNQSKVEIEKNKERLEELYMKFKRLRKRA